MRRPSHLVVGLAAALAATSLAAPAGARLDDRSATAAATSPATAFPDPADPQSWVLPEWMTWDDYRPVPGVDWNDESHQPAKKLRAALILGDFQDREFVVTQEPHSDLFCLNVVPGTAQYDPAVPAEAPPIGSEGCNPFIDAPVARDEVAEFYADLIANVPSELNHGHTMNEYWLEDSYGLIGVEATGFGPYRMSGKEHEYGLGGGDAGGGGNQCPQGDNCGSQGQQAPIPLTGGFDQELLLASLPDVTAGIATNGGEDYDFRYLLHAGYDESGTWQEFGEMLFPEREDVTARFGPPEPRDGENWAETRYVAWTSWAAAEGIWSHAIPGVLSTQGESDGAAVFAHELSHIFGVLDNYNNPYGNPVRRSYTGPWAMLSRGAFGGPGGAHNRWQIPPSLGATMGSHHMLRNKIRLGFMKPTEVLFLERESLAASGPQFATIYPRAYPLAPVTEDTGLHGIHLLMGEDRSPACSTQQDHTCDGGGYTSYTVEFVDRIGHDSFTPDSGVLIAKNKDLVDLAPFMWAIDAHPEDINSASPPPPHDGREIFDFVRPGSGEQVPISLGDMRQLADALFHAGTGEGVVSEYVDEANGLHFYVLANATDDRGVSTYRVAVRSTAAGGPFPRGVEVSAGDGPAGMAGTVVEVPFTVTNTGTGAADLVRLAVATDVDGVETMLLHEVVEAPPGDAIDVPVYVRVPAGCQDVELSLTAASETDTDATDGANATVTCSGAATPPGPDDQPPSAPSAAPPAAPTPATGGGLAAIGLLLAATAAGLLGRRPSR